MKKKILALVLALAAVLSLCLSGCGDSDTLELNVYNWGEYISDGSNDSLDVVQAFEEWYEAEYGQKVKVNYSTFVSNEDMYAKIQSGAVSYDLIFPSDYMVSRLIEEDLLLPLNFDNIPNYQYVEDCFRGLYYDPDNAYSIPYAFNTVGIIYNANAVDEADIGGWDLLWNEKYAGSILQFNNSRDAFATAMYKLGIDVNTTDKAQWDLALEELLKQRPLVKAYVMDEVFNAMEVGEADIASYYAGDYFIMVDAQADDVDLQYYVPEPTNHFVDAMCIPTCCENKELAEAFINFLLTEEVAIANAEYIWYGVPNSQVYTNEEHIEYMGEDAMAILYPSLDTFAETYNQNAYRNLPPEILDYVNTLWENLKIS